MRPNLIPHTVFNRKAFISPHKIPLTFLNLNDLYPSQARYYPGRSTSQLKHTPSFGSFERIIPASLKNSKPSPKAPDFHKVPKHIIRPTYAQSGQPENFILQIPIIDLNDAHTLSKIRNASKLAANTLKFAQSLIAPGITTNQIDSQIHDYIIKHNAYPSPLNYYGYPKSVCTSINNIIAHGIPDNRKLLDGDIINIDITVYLDGFHGDNSATFLVGSVDKPGQDLVNHTKHALDLAINLCKPNVHFYQIGNAIHEYSSTHGYSSVEDFSGHGLGTEFHQAPLIYHFSK
ncbi:Methionine aminopeptidase 1D, chloroplastic/mitochondrial [Smittium culicis]|uniref:Methionine aminopeptidase n=1 Tax=Smittium culicis TaxID=133412 RepID=A0A1R1Y7W9_9FUNG|nr:Methionine aminopeptidase 1D, chloroplastic/mitochondrial [Smittium culicis]